MTEQMGTDHTHMPDVGGAPDDLPEYPNGALPLGIVATVLHKPLGIAAVAYLVLLVAATCFGSLLAPYNPLAQDLAHVKDGPSTAHLLGTDSLGRDVLSRLLVGGQGSLLGVLEAVAVLLTIAIPFGVASGYAGGRFERIVMRIIDVKLAIPGIVVMLAMLTIFDNSMTSAMICFGVLSSGGVIRVIRSTVLELREEPYIDAAITTGLTRPQIIVRHIAPQTAGVVVVQTAMLSAVALGVQTGLSFLGFGAQPPNPSWGGMVSEAATLLQVDPWLILSSGGVVALTTIALGLLGDSVRDANVERYSGVRSPGNGTGKVDSPSRPVAEPEAGALLSVRELTISFESRSGVRSVVDGASFDIRAGETVGLVGESGSGKTVTALSLLGLLPTGGSVTGGRIVYDGKDLAGLRQSEYRRLRGSEIAMISQEPMVALDPSFRVGYQVAEVVRTHDGCTRAQARERAVELLRAVRLPDPEAVSRRYPHQVSGGMAQRIAIAVALAGRPRLLIADEPTTAMDVTVQAELLELLSTLQEETGMAILLVTHDWAVVSEVCTRSVVMYAGQVVERASVDDMFAQPKHPYTTGLLASSPHLARRGHLLPTIGGTVPPPELWPRGCHFAPRCSFATDECRASAVAERETEPGRVSRCIRVDELVKGGRL